MNAGDLVTWFSEADRSPRIGRVTEVAGTRFVFVRARDRVVRLDYDQVRLLRDGPRDVAAGGQTRLEHIAGAA